jgi:Spy/CpxP family protein refolding chaperone
MCKRKSFGVLLALLLLLSLPGFSQETYSHPLPSGWEGLSLQDQWDLLRISVEQRELLKNFETLTMDYEQRVQSLSERSQSLENLVSRAEYSEQEVRTVVNDLTKSLEKLDTQNKILRVSLIVVGTGLVISLIF